MISCTICLLVSPRLIGPRTCGFRPAGLMVGPSSEMQAKVITARSGGAEEVGDRTRNQHRDKTDRHQIEGPKAKIGSGWRTVGIRY